MIAKVPARKAFNESDSGILKPIFMVWGFEVLCKAVDKIGLSKHAFRFLSGSTDLWNCAAITLRRSLVAPARFPVSCGSGALTNAFQSNDILLYSTVGGSPLDNNVGDSKNFWKSFEVVLSWCVLYPRAAVLPSEIGQSA